MSLSFVSGKLAFLHDGYIATMVVVKCTLFTTHVASLMLGASFNTILAMHVTSLSLGASFNTEVVTTELYT